MKLLILASLISVSFLGACTKKTDATQEMAAPTEGTEAAPPAEEAAPTEEATTEETTN